MRTSEAVTESDIEAAEPNPVRLAIEAVGGQERLGELIGVTQSFISQLANEKRPVPAAVAIRIEEATNGKVTRADLRPDDYRELWPEFAAKLDRQQKRREAHA